MWLPVRFLGRRRERVPRPVHDGPSATTAASAPATRSRHRSGALVVEILVHLRGQRPTCQCAGRGRFSARTNKLGRWRGAGRARTAGATPARSDVPVEDPGGDLLEGGARRAWGQGGQGGPGPVDLGQGGPPGLLERRRGSQQGEGAGDRLVVTLAVEEPGELLGIPAAPAEQV